MEMYTDVMSFYMTLLKAKWEVNQQEGGEFKRHMKHKSVLTWRGGGGFIIGVDPGEYYTWKFYNLVVNSGMRIGPIKGLSAVEGKVR